MRIAACLSALALCAGCAAVTSSAYLHAAPLAPAAGPVAVRLTSDPEGAVELGVVEAHGQRPAATLQALLDELRSRVAAVGGDVARVDALATRFELVDESYTYDCGTTVTTTEPRTVSRTECSGGATPGGACHTTMHTETVTVTKHEPRTCTGVRRVQAEVLALTGRAFRSKGAQP